MIVSAGFFTYLCGYNFYNLMLKSDINLNELFSAHGVDEQEDNADLNAEEQQEFTRLRSFNYENTNELFIQVKSALIILFTLYMLFYYSLSYYFAKWRYVCAISPENKKTFEEYSGKSTSP